MTNTTYNRKLEQFQAKVQQSIELADDEIERLKNYLNSVKIEILDLRDQKTRYEQQYQQDQHEKKGQIIKEMSKKDAQLAKIEAEHHAAVLDLNKAHQTRIDMMNSDFDKSLKEIEEDSNKKSERELKKYDDLASRLEEQIKRAAKRLNNEKDSSKYDESDSDDEELNPEEDENKYMMDTLNIEEQKIKALQDSIKQRDQERLQALNKSKKQLNDAVNALETLEKAHVQKMDNYKKAIETLDDKYKKSISSLTNGQKKQLMPGKKRIAAAEKHIQQLQQQISKTEEQQNVKLLSLTDKRDRLKQEFVSVTSKTIEKPSFEEAHEAERQADGLRKQLEKKENELLAARSENQAIKRELGRLKHITRVSKRRSALGIE